MRKHLLFTVTLTLLCCNKKNYIENKQITDSVVQENKNIDTLKSLSADSLTQKIVEQKPNLIINKFSNLPTKYSNDSDANAYFYTDSNQAQKGGTMYGVCDFINNVFIIKLNNKFEKLNDISGTDSYLENKIFENANYRLELDLNEKISDKLSNKILKDIPLEGAYVLKGNIKVIDLSNNNEITKNTFVLGF